MLTKPNVVLQSLYFSHLLMNRRYHRSLHFKHPLLRNILYIQILTALWTKLIFELKRAVTIKQRLCYLMDGNMIISYLVYFWFALDGTKLATGLNYPRETHENSISEWAGVYEKLQHPFDQTGGRCAGED